MPNSFHVSKVKAPFRNLYLCGASVSPSHLCWWRVCCRSRPISLVDSLSFQVDSVLPWEWPSSEHPSEPALLQSFAPDFAQEHDLSSASVRHYVRLFPGKKSTQHPQGPKPDVTAAAWCHACDAALMPVTPVCRFIVGCRPWWTVAWCQQAPRSDGTAGRGARPELAQTPRCSMRSVASMKHKWWATRHPHPAKLRRTH